MKSKFYLLAYLCALLIGLLLLWRNDDVNLFHYVVIAIGIIFLIPSVTALIDYFIPSKRTNDTRTPKPWYIAVMGIVGLVIGVLLVFMPSFWTAYIIYTFGIVLILCGVSQIVNFAVLKQMGTGISRTYYLMPWIVIFGGVAVIIMGPNGMGKIATIVTAIFLICYGINGLIEMIAVKHPGVNRIGRES